MMSCKMSIDKVWFSDIIRVIGQALETEDEMESHKVTRIFETRSGRKVTVTGQLILEKDTWLDGHTGTMSVCEKYINVEVDGKGRQGSRIDELTASQKAVAPAGYTHKVGNLGLTSEQVEIIQSVKDEIASHPRWVAKVAADEAKLEAYENKMKKLSDSPGYCHRCGSYCWGDCTA